MNFHPPLEVGRLERRYKRFLADLVTDHGPLTVHCPNTGAMLGCDDPGSEVWYSDSGNERRKYRHTLEVVCTPAGRVGVNSARANRLVEEAVAGGRVGELQGYEQIKREAAIPEGKGRFDFVLEGERGRCFVEVKSMTLCLPGGTGAFPDAVSERALRHVDALMRRKRAGDRAVLLFCVQHTGVDRATTADAIYPEYGEAVRRAVSSGVEVIAYGCRIDRDAIRLDRALPVELR
ncbi:MAG: DNA/RNA nuclease SfsA [Pseudomonadales bacterium]|nr:DNA/RNA nuclease SfsA [Pseudomonadales bacterium]NIX09356.1 DNA/RNA nuclease SfsA [Pseudomonadales bacterium]